MRRLNKENICTRKDVFGQCIYEPINFKQQSRPYNRATTVSPLPPSSFVPESERSKIDKKDDEQLKPPFRGRGYKPSNIRPNITTIPDEVMEDAHLARASSLFKEEGMESAEQYLTRNGVEGRIDGELSNDVGLVFERPDGKVSVNYRGTNPTNVDDLKTDINLITGKTDINSLEHIKTAKSQLTDVIGKYGREDLRLTGFSLGGQTAIHVGDELKIPTRTFNPLLGYQTLKNFAKNNIHEIYRTTTDPASIGLGINNQGFDIKTIHPLEDTLNPVKSHQLDNFLENKSRPSPTQLTELINETYDQGVELSNLHNDINNIVDDYSEGAEEMKGGETADEYMTRTGEDPFIPELEEYIKGVEAQDVADIPRKDRVIEFLDKLDPNDEILEDIDLSDHLERHQELKSDLGENVEALNEAGELHGEMGKSLVESFHPTNVVGGLVGAIGGAVLADKIDPKGAEHNTLFHQGLSGGLSGVGAEGFATLASGEALTASGLLPAAAGGAAGLLAGEATQEATEKSLGVGGSQVLGGAVGGGVAGVTTTGLAAAGGLAATELGIAEASVALAPETLGLSLVGGAVIGAGVATGAYVANRYGSDIKRVGEKAVGIVKDVSDVQKDIQSVQKAGSTVMETGLRDIEKTGQAISSGVKSVESGISKGAKVIGNLF
tara:strand:+ start:6606 stop:8600 length:1995 start_codon:yes stop_codon:yes gene_type:complete